MSTETIIYVLAGIVLASTPLLLAGIGELVTEKSGVLNLGVEGMMAVGAIVAFIVTYHTSSPTLGLLSGAIAGGVMSLCFAVLTLSLLANQVASGLALALTGAGLSAFIGRAYSGQAIPKLDPVMPKVLADLPIAGALLFHYDAVTYIALTLVLVTHWWLSRTKSGRILRAVGESPEAAHANGYPVRKVRYLSTFFGGVCAGLGGAYLSVVFSAVWVDGLIAGRGWIALALVVFATWRSLRLVLGAYLFGGMTVMQLHGQAMGLPVASELMSMTPYLATIVVLSVIARNPRLILLNQPLSLGRVFHPEHKLP